jgi:hypothetical protein
VGCLKDGTGGYRDYGRGAGEAECTIRYATVLLPPAGLAGLSDFEAMALSRHKDRKMLERYTHEQEALDGSLLRALGDKINNSFGELPVPV